ncbi:MAG: hypothetical protein KDJ36_04520 [Hyphomicrobiaceae bacterium]|nr:hypothetical protein [Hyphomicrobiaceae bacterium]
MFDALFHHHWAISPIGQDDLDIDLTRRPTAHDYSTPEWAAVIGMLFGAVFVVIALFMVDLADTYLTVFSALFALGGLTVVYLFWVSFALKRYVYFDDDRVRFVGKAPWGDRLWEARYRDFEGLVMRKQVVERKTRTAGNNDDFRWSTKHTYFILELRHSDPSKTIPIYVAETDEMPRGRWVKMAKALEINAIQEVDGARLERSHAVLGKSIAERANEAANAIGLPDIPRSRDRFDKSGMFRRDLTAGSSAADGSEDPDIPQFLRGRDAPPVPPGLRFETSNDGATTVLLPGRWDGGKIGTAVFFVLVGVVSAARFGGNFSTPLHFAVLPMLFAVLPAASAFRRRFAKRRVTFANGVMTWASVWLPSAANFDLDEITDVDLHNGKLLIASADRQVAVGEGLEPEYLHYMRAVIVAACTSHAGRAVSSAANGAV